MNSKSPARASSLRCAAAKPTASKPEDRARSRIASRIASVTAGSAAPAIGGDTGIGQPQPGGWRAGLVEDVDRDTAARIPIAADPQPLWGERLDQPAGDRERAVFVKRR